MLLYSTIAVTVVAFIGWAFFFKFRDNPILAFPLWFPFTSILGIATLYLLMNVLAIFSAHGPGAQVSIAYLFTAVSLVPAPFLFILSLRKRPKQSTAPRIICSTIGACILVPMLIMVADYYLSLTIVHFTFSQQDSRPISGAVLSYTDRYNVTKFLHSDENGTVTVHLPLGGRLGGQIHKDGCELVLWGITAPEDRKGVVLFFDNRIARNYPLINGAPHETPFPFVSHFKVEIPVTLTPDGKNKH